MTRTMLMAAALALTAGMPFPVQATPCPTTAAQFVQAINGLNILNPLALMDPLGISFETAPMQVATDTPMTPPAWPKDKGKKALENLAMLDKPVMSYRPILDDAKYGDTHAKRQVSMKAKAVDNGALRHAAPNGGPLFIA